MSKSIFVDEMNIAYQSDSSHCKMEILQENHSRKILQENHSRQALGPSYYKINGVEIDIRCLDTIIRTCDNLLRVCDGINIGSTFERLSQLIFSSRIYTLPIEEIYVIIDHFSTNSIEISLGALYSFNIIYDSTDAYVNYIKIDMQTFEYLNYEFNNDSIQTSKLITNYISLPSIFSIDYIVNKFPVEIINKYCKYFGDKVILDRELESFNFYELYQYMRNHNIDFSHCINRVVCKLMSIGCKFDSLKNIIDENIVHIKREKENSDESNDYKILQYLSENGVSMKKILKYHTAIVAGSCGRNNPRELSDID